MKKNKYNPSGKPVLTKGMKSQKGAFLKNIERNTKRLTVNMKYKRKK